MIHFFKLIRWKNLVMIALVQYLIKYALLLPFQDSHGVSVTLDGFNFALLVLATLFIAAAGYIINDINDIETDKINKPDKVIINQGISEKNAFTFFMILNIIGVGIGFYLANDVGKSALFVMFFASSALLYLYSSSLKQMPLIGNIIVSLVVALAPIVVGFFELFPSMTIQNRSIQITFFKIILDYAIFAFMINLIRELVKDIEDIDGDYKASMETLPILIGRARTNKIVFVLSLIPTFSVIYYVITYLYKQPLVVGYFLLVVIAPLIYVTIKLFNAEQKSQYRHISLVLKLVLLSGMLSLLLYSFILN
jgi:4-hydroxybenzoate polyprenyltransferase